MEMNQQLLSADLMVGIQRCRIFQMRMSLMGSNVMMWASPGQIPSATAGMLCMVIGAGALMAECHRLGHGVNKTVQHVLGMFVISCEYLLRGFGSEADPVLMHQGACGVCVRLQCMAYWRASSLPQAHKLHDMMHRQRLCVSIYNVPHSVVESSCCVGRLWQFMQLIVVMNQHTHGLF